MIEGVMLFTKRFIGKVKVKFYSKQEDYNLNKICHFVAKFSQILRSGNDNFAEIKTKIWTTNQMTCCTDKAEKKKYSAVYPV